MIYDLYSFKPKKPNYDEEFLLNFPISHKSFDLIIIGSGGSGLVHRGNAWGKNCPESRSSLAVSYRLEALAGLRLNCGRPGAHPRLIRRHSADESIPVSLPSTLILSGARAVVPGFFSVTGEN